MIETINIGRNLTGRKIIIEGKIREMIINPTEEQMIRIITETEISIHLNIEMIIKEMIGEEIMIGMMIDIIDREIIKMTNMIVEEMKIRIGKEDLILVVAQMILKKAVQDHLHSHLFYLIEIIG